MPRSETRWHAFWEAGVPSAWGDPEGCQSKGDFLEDVFAPTIVLAKAANSSFCRVSGHIQ